MRYPGFIDSHMHVLGLGYVSTNVDLTEQNSISSVIETLNSYRDRTILIGRGWNQNQFEEQRMLQKQDLDLVSKEIPIIMVRVCGHVLTVNSKMLEICGVTQDTPQIVGGHFDYDTGVFSEKALGLIYDRMPRPTKEDLRHYFITANEILVSNGITSVASDDFCIFPIPYEEVIDVMKELYQEDLLQVKITEQVNLSLADLKDFIAKGYVNQRFGKLKMGPHKILADGSLGGKTAALNAPYENEPDNLGILTFTDEELFEKVHLADSHGMDVVVHAIGDRTADQVIDTLVKSLEITKRTDHHHAIIHAQLTTKKQIERMKQYNIGAIVQPIFLNTDIPIVKERIGERHKESYLFGTMDKQGVIVGLSTDSPIEPVNPFYNIYTAIARKSIKYPGLEPFLPEEGLSLSRAIQCYTTENLRYVYEDKLPDADHIEIDRNLSRIDVEELLELQVRKTVIDGITVYEKE
ncbi:MAG: amidohydrolase [Bacilli bacterium]|nr:amidohydrolase [Bacilli bacterium]MBN2876784.1 amidohydrolase [Bacilli bacterium]